jgi:hypothetical protein
MAHDEYHQQKWYGTVTTKNIDKIAEMMHWVLDGKKYSVVHCYEYKRWEPELRIHQELGGSVDGDDIKVHHHNGEHAQLLLCDTYGVGGFSTTCAEGGYVYDPDFQSPYVVLEYGHTIKITQRAPNGLLFYTVYRVE